MVSNESKKSRSGVGTVWKTLCAINQEFRLYPEGHGKPAIKTVFQKSNMIRYEVYKDHSGNIGECFDEAGLEAGK